jgi:hypothetical protein
MSPRGKVVTHQKDGGCLGARDFNAKYPLVIIRFKPDPTLALLPPFRLAQPSFLISSGNNGIILCISRRRMSEVGQSEVQIT